MIPTTIGALISAIGIVGMDRLVQHNVLAMSGRPVEDAGAVDTLLLYKTGTITLGHRQPSRFVPAPNANSQSIHRCFMSYLSSARIIAPRCDPKRVVGDEHNEHMPAGII